MGVLDCVNVTVIVFVIRAFYSMCIYAVCNLVRNECNEWETWF